MATLTVIPTSIPAGQSSTITCSGTGWTQGYTVAIDYRGNCAQNNPCIDAPPPSTVAADGTFSVPWTLTLPRGTYHPFAFVSDPSNSGIYSEQQTTLQVR